MNNDYNKFMSMKTDKKPRYSADSFHIMVIDDEDHVGLFIEIFLTSRGYLVTRYTNGMDALLHFDRTPGDFDLIITDQNMPNICGSDLAKKLLAVRADIPIILCTGFGHDEIADSTQEIGIAAYLPKPLEPGVLLQHVKQFINKAGSRFKYGVGT